MLNFLYMQYTIFRRLRTAVRAFDRHIAGRSMPSKVATAKVFLCVIGYRWVEGYEPSSRELDIAQACKQEIMIWEWEGNP